MSISKTVGIVTGAIPIVGILIGGITFGIGFKTDVENIKTDVANQQQINDDVEEWFSSLPSAYDDSLIWANAVSINERIDNIHIPDRYDDSHLDERIQSLALNVIELRTELDNLEIQDVENFDDSDLRGRLAELEGQLSALASIDMTSDDGSVDLGPLVVRIATAEGTLSSLKSSIDSIKGDIRTIKSDITSVERTANTAKSTADSARSSSGGSRTIENNYDDSNLRSRVSTLERQVNAIPTTSSGGGTTIQRVENDFNDASLRADISALQTAVAVLQATGSNSYDDSNLRDMIDDIQWDLDNLDIPTTPDTVDTTWIEDLMYDIKNELSMRIDELEWASDTTTTSDDMYAEKWMFEDLQYEVMYIQEQVWELQTLINDSQSSANNNTTTSNDIEGGANANSHLYINHNQDSYTGDYWLDGEYNGHPLWVNWECGNPGSQFEYCYIFRYPVGFTNSGWVWVIQPIPPSDEWSANAYTDGRWPWKKEWSGNVNSVDVID